MLLHAKRAARAFFTCYERGRSGLEERGGGPLPCGPPPEKTKDQERFEVFFVTPALAAVAFGATVCFADSTSDAVQAL